jgi:hypothetical protein
MKDLGLFSGTLEMDTNKLKDQLNAISMAAGALAHNLAEIDATYAEGESGLYTKTMVDPEAVAAKPKQEIEAGDFVYIENAGKGRGETPQLVGLYGRVVSVAAKFVRVCVREESEHFVQSLENYVCISQLRLIAKAVK